MKPQTVLAMVFSVLLLASLACGSSGVEVNPPASGGEGPSQSPTATPASGTARSNPAALGSEVLVDDMAFQVRGFTRPATEIIMTGNMFNTEPEPGQEYILVDITITCRKSVDDKCSLFSSSFTLLGSAGVSRTAESFIAGVDGLIDWNSEFYGGATVTGNVPFIIGSDETGLLLVYEPFLGDAFYLAIE